MINNSNFSKRLKKVLEYYQLSASQFAERINVQRSSISHLLSGRNKPSLDFVLKVLDNFKEVELYWLLYGKGSFPKNEKNDHFPTSLFSTGNESVTEKSESDNKEQQNQPYVDSTSKSFSFNDEIDKIVVFYKNGTFKQFKETK